ncbi:hypothetical protein M3Y99_00937100 [Aphelenchoides fujianensis]|nr:hypothetical protein M3Y99_00937100 [Aphelenchoides fujianensis]
MLQLDGRRTVGNPPPDPAFARLLTAASCREKHHLVLHHLDQFLRRYPHEPNFKPEDRRLLGASLLHPLPGPRDCHSLRIPFQYCLCLAAQRPSADSRTAALIAEAAVARMNAELAAAGFDLLCAHLTLDAAWPPEIYELGGGHFKVVLRALPRGAVHEAFARVADGRVEFLVDTFPQLTQYNQFAFCIPRGLFLQNYCYCGPRKSAQRVGRFGQFLFGNDTR